MAKYSTDFKIMVAQNHLESATGARTTAALFGIDHGSVRKWSSIYQLHGPRGLSKQSRIYALADKIRVLQRIEQEN